METSEVAAQKTMCRGCTNSKDVYVASEGVHHVSVFECAATSSIFVPDMVTRLVLATFAGTKVS